MIAITVDDERPMLKALTDMVKASPDIKEVYDFSACSAALEWISENRLDVAFLDINMRGMGGLALAEKITEIYPECKIVFCTGYEEYALNAIQLRCSGYLMKPITPEAVQKEIDHIKSKNPNVSLLDVKCFGNFEVLKNGDLKKALANVGAENVFCQDGYNYRIEPSRINCDYHNFLKTGKPSFHGEYMTQYSWAEDTLALLLETN